MLRSTIITRALGQKAAQSIYYAVQQAERIGHPITHLVTLNFAATKCLPWDAPKVFQELRRHRFNKWLARPRQGCGKMAPATHFYVFENERFGVPFETMELGDDHNVHVHWAVHIPPDRFADFEACLWSWMEELTGGIVDACAIDVKLADTPASLKRYMLKGTQSNRAEFYGAFAQPQGLIVGGRRSGTSRNLGRTRRVEMDRALGIRRRIPARNSASRPVMQPSI